MTTFPNGLFLDSIASHFDEIIVFGYLAVSTEQDIVRYEIAAQNIEFVSLGNHNNIFKRLLRFPIVYYLVNDRIKEAVHFVVRGPTPMMLLLPLIIKRKKVILYLVGEYIMNPDSKLPLFKRVLLYILYSFVRISQNNLIKDNSVFTNSAFLAERLSKIASFVEIIKSTTIKSKDLHKRDFKIESPVKLMFAGRIDESKGIFQMVEAIAKMNQKGLKTELHLAGIANTTMMNDLQELILLNKCQDKIHFHGLLAPGKELSVLYKNCHIFVIASQSDFEGFPRVLWEAMANSLPIIASPVSSIPYYLKHKESAYFLNRDNIVQSIIEGVTFILDNPTQVQKMIHNAFLLAKDNTLEKQGERFYNAIKRIPGQ